MTYKLDLVKKALEQLKDAINNNYYEKSDILQPNYSEICEWLGWPDLQDGGLYEQSINMAAKIIQIIYRY